MKRRILFLLLLSLFYGVGAYEIETSSQIYFVITPEGQSETLGIVPEGTFSVEDNEYTNYMGVILGNEGWLYVDSILQLRTDGTKYFCYDRMTDSEHILFDYSLKKGEAFTDDFNKTIYEVTDVRDTLVNNESLRLIELKNSNGKRDVWMEGVGSIYTGILRANEYYRNTCLLISCPFDGEDFGTEGFPIYSYPNNQSIKTAEMDITELRWDKPVETEVDWETYQEWARAPTNLNAEFIDDTLHVWGRLNTSGGGCIHMPHVC